MPYATGDKPRVEPRVRAMVRAGLVDSLGERDVCIIDVSTRGVLATAARPPARGEFVEIQMGRHRLAGLVRWAGERRFGIALQERVSVAAMVEGGTKPIKLERSVGTAQRRQGGWQALRDNPHLMGRAMQFGVLAIAALSAAFLINEMVGIGFQPMQQAVMGMNAPSPN